MFYFKNKREITYQPYVSLKTVMSSGNRSLPLVSFRRRVRARGSGTGAGGMYDGSTAQQQWRGRRRRGRKVWLWRVMGPWCDWPALTLIKPRSAVITGLRMCVFRAGAAAAFTERSEKSWTTRTRERLQWKKQAQISIRCETRVSSFFFLKVACRLSITS